MFICNQLISVPKLKSGFLVISDSVYQWCTVVTTTVVVLNWDGRVLCPALAHTLSLMVINSPIRNVCLTHNAAAHVTMQFPSSKIARRQQTVRAARRTYAAVRRCANLSFDSVPSLSTNSCGKAWLKSWSFLFCLLDSPPCKGTTSLPVLKCTLIYANELGGRHTKFR